MIIADAPENSEEYLYPTDEENIGIEEQKENIDPFKEQDE
jgi:hypothetical protein